MPDYNDAKWTEDEKQLLKEFEQARDAGHLKNQDGSEMTEDEFLAEIRAGKSVGDLLEGRKTREGEADQPGQWKATHTQPRDS